MVVPEGWQWKRCALGGVILACGIVLTHVAGEPKQSLHVTTNAPHILDVPSSTTVLQAAPQQWSSQTVTFQQSHPRRGALLERSSIQQQMQVSVPAVETCLRWALFVAAPLAFMLYGTWSRVVRGNTHPASVHALALVDTEPSQTTEDFDARAFRRSLNKTGRYNRKVLKDAESVALMESDGVGYSRTGLVAQMRTGSFEHTEGDVTVRLADAYGFCWGVERAVQMAYETRKVFPDRKIFITNEIIHNPTVNQRLEDLGLTIMEGNEEFSKLQEGDVAVLPAFGASVQVMKSLADKNVQLVDTTCPWVSKVWNAVGNQKDAAHTSIVHGKWAHEETIATVSFAGNYLVVKDLKQAEYLANYILNGGNKEEFLAYFGTNAMSKGFDPETMLTKIGLANQTTMLKGETVAIGKLLESTMMQKYGPQARRFSTARISFLLFYDE
eukprot:EG_transcript_8528